MSVVTSVGLGCRLPMRPPHASATSAAKAHYPGMLPQGVTPHMYDVHLTLDPNEPSFGGQVAIYVEVREPRRVIYLHAESLSLQKVWATLPDGSTREPEVTTDPTPGLLALRFDEPLTPGMSTLHLSFTGQWSDNLLGLYRVSADGNQYVFSQFEPIAARRAFPCFDEPRFKTPFALRVTAPKDLTVLTGSSVQAEQIKEKDGQADLMRTTTFATTPPLPTYLLAFAVGPFAVSEGEVSLNALRSYPLPLRVLGTAKQGAMLAPSKAPAEALLSALESYTLLPYPFAKLDLLAVPDFAFGAMENAGLITFRNNLLLQGKEAPYPQVRGALGVLAHELTHQWFGNWVTMQWWDDLWLNESFATWQGGRRAQALRPEMRFDLELTEGMTYAMHVDRLRSTRRMREPVHNRDDIFNASDATVYQKGASVLGMVEHWLGHDRLKQGVQAYLRAHPFGTATSTDFVQALAKEAEEPAVAGVMQSFLDQPGVPEIEFSLACNNEAASLQLSQDRFRPLGSEATSALWQLPVCVRYGRQGNSHQSCTVLKEGRGELPLRGGCPDWLVTNADGAGYYRSRGDAQATLRQLTALRRHELHGAEAIAFADNLEAGLGSGALPAEYVLPLLVELLGHKERQVVSFCAQALVSVYARHLEADASYRQAQALSALLVGALAVAEQDVVKQMGAVKRGPQHGAAGEAARDELGEAVSVRQTLRYALATHARNSHLRANLSHMGVAWLDRLERAAHKPGTEEPLAFAVRDKELTAEDAPLALAMALSTLGKPFMQRLLDALPLADAGAQRASLIAAFAAQDDADVAEALRSMLLTDTFRVNERMRVLGGQLGRPSLAKAAWGYVQAKQQALLLALSEHDRQVLLQHVGAVHDPALGAALLKQFAGEVALVPGGPRVLAQAEEEQRLLHAEHEAAAGAVARFFTPAGSLGGKKQRRTAAPAGGSPS